MNLMRNRKGEMTIRWFVGEEKNKREHNTWQTDQNNIDIGGLEDNLLVFFSLFYSCYSQSLMIVQHINGSSVLRVGCDFT